MPRGLPDMASPAGARPRQRARVPRWPRGSGRAVAPRQDMAHPATGQPVCPRPGPILLTALRPPRCSPESRTQGLTADPPSHRPLPRSAINPPARPERLRPEPTPGTAPGAAAIRCSPHHERHVRQDPTGHSPADQAEAQLGASPTCRIECVVIVDIIRRPVWRIETRSAFLSGGAADHDRGQSGPNKSAFQV
jgi:hypothetical protein